MQSQRSTTRRRVLTRVIIVLALAFLLGAILVVYVWRFFPLNREWVVETLEKRYQCEVELKSLTASLFPAVSIAGEGLVLKRKERSDLPPLALIRKFSVKGDWLGLLRHPRHFRQVRLEGMVIAVPPRLKQAQAKRALCWYDEGIEELKPCLAFQLRGWLPDPYHASGHRVRAVNGNNSHHLARCERDACLYSCPLRGNVHGEGVASFPFTLLLRKHDYSHFCDPALGPPRGRLDKAGHGL